MSLSWMDDSWKLLQVTQWVCLRLYYQVSSSSQYKQSETEVKVLLDDQVTQERSQHNPTHTQEVGDRPRILILQRNRSEMS